MKTWIGRVRWFAVVALALTAVSGAGAETVRHLVIDGMITPATSYRFDAAFDQAKEAGDVALLVELDTPGGLVAATEPIVQAMLASEIPVIVWVGPAGAHAASAGFFLLLAADVAAMAPGTRTGAASVIYSGGQSSEDDVGLKKANQDAAALLRSIANRRERNVEAAERAVFEATAYTETDALDLDLIDRVDPDVRSLLDGLDGTPIARFDGGSVTLDLENATLVPATIDIRGKILDVLANPAVAYLLLMGGLLGLYVEITNPGLIFPGVVGAICLVLFAMAFRVLPITAIGTLLILLAIVLFLLEIKVTSYGFLTAAGVACLLLGSMMLVRGPIPQLRVSPAVYVPTCIVLGGFAAFVVSRVRSAQRSHVATGYEGLVGSVGEVSVALAPAGKVFVHGEIWDAVSDVGAIEAGRPVRIVHVDDLKLRVEPMTSGGAREAKDD